MGSKLIYQPLEKKHSKDIRNTYVKHFWDDHMASQSGKIPMTTTVDEWHEYYDDYDAYGIVAYDDDKLVSVYYSTKSEWTYNSDKIQGMELLFFILPEYRKGKTFLKFLEEIENVNKQNSVDFYNLMIPYAQSALANKLSKYGFKSEAICVRKEIT